MTIKFEKEIEVTGKTWFKVIVNNCCEFASEDQQRAKDHYLKIISNAQNGLPSRETLEEITITPKP